MVAINPVRLNTKNAAPLTRSMKRAPELSLWPPVNLMTTTEWMTSASAKAATPPPNDLQKEGEVIWLSDRHGLSRSHFNNCSWKNSVVAAVR